MHLDVAKQEPEPVSLGTYFSRNPQGLNIFQGMALIVQFLTVFSGLMMVVKESMAINNGKKEDERSKDIVGGIILVANTGALFLPLLSKLLSAHLEIDFSGFIDAMKKCLPGQAQPAVRGSGEAFEDDKKGLQEGQAGSTTVQHVNVASEDADFQAAEGAGDYQLNATNVSANSFAFTTEEFKLQETPRLPVLSPQGVIIVSNFSTAELVSTPYHQDHSLGSGVSSAEVEQAMASLHLVDDAGAPVHGPTSNISVEARLFALSGRQLTGSDRAKEAFKGIQHQDHAQHQDNIEEVPIIAFSQGPVWRVGTR